MFFRNVGKPVPDGMASHRGDHSLDTQCHKCVCVCACIK